MEKKFDTVLNESSLKPVVGAEIIVREYPSGVLAFIYSANNPTTENRIEELLTNDKGYFEFYAADGRYTIEIWYDGKLKTKIDDVLFEDPKDSNEVNSNLSTQSNVNILSGVIRLDVEIEALAEIRADITELQTQNIDYGLISAEPDNFDDYGAL